MKSRITPGFFAGVSIALVIAALPTLIFARWLPGVLLAAGIAAGIVAFGLWIRDRRERNRRSEFQELLERVADVGAEVVELRRGPTFDAWREDSERILAAAIGPAEASEALGPPDADVVSTLDPMLVLSGFPFGWDYIAKLRAIAARAHELQLSRRFRASDWSIFDPDRWQETHARAIHWEPQNGAPCPWCGHRFYPSDVSCDGCGVLVGAEFAFK